MCVCVFFLRMMFTNPVVAVVCSLALNLQFQLLFLFVSLLLSPFESVYVVVVVCC